MKIIIVGGVAGGMSAATRLRRLMEDAEIIIFEKGPFVSFANCGLPYYVSGEIAEPCSVSCGSYFFRIYFLTISQEVNSN